MSNNKFFLAAKDYLIITFSLLLYSTGVVAFLVPAEIVSGGVSGIGTLIYFYSNGAIPVAVPFLLINAVLVTIGIKLFGAKFGLKTVFAIIVTSIFLYLGQKIVTEPIVHENFMATIIGGMCAGAGVGLAISQGGSTGGTDIIALIVNHYWNISLGRTILYADIIIVSCSYLIFKSLTPMVYGFVAMAVTAYFVDFMITGRKQSVQFFIFTDKHNEVAARIEEEIGRGISLVSAYGWHTKKERRVVMVLTRKVESRQILRIVKEVDDRAFVSMNAVTGVYGNGFEIIR